MIKREREKARERERETETNDGIREQQIHKKTIKINMRDERKTEQIMISLQGMAEKGL